jgi:hypothetical protein
MTINGSGRYELKYVLTREQYSSVVEDLAAYMQPDPHGDEDGHYLVTSLYYDTPDSPIRLRLPCVGQGWE